MSVTFAVKVRSVVAVVLTAFLLLAPSASAVGPFGQTSSPVQSDRVSKTWKRVSSAHFTAVGDASEGDLRDVLKELEVFRAAIGVLSSSWRFRSPAPTLVLFRNDDAFAPFKPRDERGRILSQVGGYYLAEPEGVTMVMAAGTAGYLREQQFQTVLHEFAHDLVHLNLPALPVWLNEGLAEFQSSIAAGTDEQTRFLGRPLRDRLRSLWYGPLLPVRDIIDPESAARLQVSERDGGLFYAQSWLLVHYLILGRKGATPAHLDAYLRNLRSGLSGREAFTAAFGATPEEIDGELTDYARLNSYGALPLRIPPGLDREIGPATALHESEVDALLGRLLLSQGELADADGRLGRALAGDPASSTIRRSLARLRNSQGREAEAIGLLAGAGSIDDFATCLYLGDALAAVGRYDEARQSYERAVGADPTDTDALLALSFAALASDEAGLAAVVMEQLQATEADPSRYYDRARRLWTAGRYQDVLTDIQTLMRLRPGGKDATAYERYLGVLAARRLGQHAVADKLLSDLDGARFEKEWTATVLAYFRERIGADDFLKKAATPGEQTEAHAYLGVMASIANQRDIARTHLTWVRDHGLKSYTEYGLAASELKRLAQ